MNRYKRYERLTLRLFRVLARHRVIVSQRPPIPPLVLALHGSACGPLGSALDAVSSTC